MKTKREQILDKAQKLICGERSNVYGNPLDNMQHTANYWNNYLQGKLSKPITAQDVALMMVLVKFSRLNNTPNHYDSILDSVGYMAISAEALDEPKQQ